MLLTMPDKSKSLELASVVKLNPNVLFKRLGDEMVLFHLETDRFYELNGTAARFWELLNEAGNAVEARERIIEEFEVDPDLFAEEAEALLTSFRQEDLVSLDE